MQVQFGADRRESKETSPSCGWAERILCQQCRGFRWTTEISQLNSRGNQVYCFVGSKKLQPGHTMWVRKWVWNFADKLKWDQFIATLASETVQGKLTSQASRQFTKVTLKEVVKVEKCFEATMYANQLMKTTGGSQEQVDYTSRAKNCPWYRGQLPLNFPSWMSIWEC